MCGNDRVKWMRWLWLRLIRFKMAKCKPKRWRKKEKIKANVMKNCSIQLDVVNKSTLYILIWIECFDFTFQETANSWFWDKALLKRYAWKKHANECAIYSRIVARKLSNGFVLVGWLCMRLQIAASTFSRHNKYAIVTFLCVTKSQIAHNITNRNEMFCFHDFDWQLQHVIKINDYHWYCIFHAIQAQNQSKGENKRWTNTYLVFALWQWQRAKHPKKTKTLF